MRSSPTLHRDRETTWIYAVAGFSAFSATGLGAVLLPLSQERGVTYAAVSFYPALYAAANVAAGLVSGMVARRLGLHRTGLLGIVLVMVGTLCFLTPATSLLAPLVLGCGGSFLAIMVPARLAQLYGIHTAVIQAEANATSSAVSITPSLLVSVALTAGVSWKLGFVAPAVLSGVVLLLVAVLQPPGSQRPLPEPLPTTSGSGSVARPMWGLLLAVSAEFAIVYWAAPVSQSWYGISSAFAVLSSGTFIAGVAGGRVLARGFIRSYSAPRVVVGGAIVALTGFTTFFFSPWYAMGLGALLLMGLGVSVLYPVLITRLMAAFPDNRERGAQLALLSTGLASGASPWLLGLLTTVAPLRMALLVVPCYLAILVVVQPGAVAYARRRITH